MTENSRYERLLLIQQSLALHCLDHSLLSRIWERHILLAINVHSVNLCVREICGREEGGCFRVFDDQLRPLSPFVLGYVRGYARVEDSLNVATLR